MEEHNWCQIVRSKSRKFDPEKVYFFAKGRKTKNKTTSLEGTIYFGKVISDLMKLTKDDKVDIYFDIPNPYLLKIVKASSPFGYKLYNNVDSLTLRFQFTCPREIKLNCGPSVPIEFNLLADLSMLINLSKFKAV